MVQFFSIPIIISSSAQLHSIPIRGEIGIPKFSLLASRRSGILVRGVAAPAGLGPPILRSARQNRRSALIFRRLLLGRLAAIPTCAVLV
jgi:hypothetical protein